MRKSSEHFAAGDGARQDPGLVGVPKFKLVPFKDIRFVMSDEWLVKKLVPRQGVAVLYGLPMAFKSFIAMSIGLHVALGWEWAGRATAQGDVVYIAAENAKGVRKRKVGFEMAHDANLPDHLPFYLVEAAPNLGLEKNDLDALIASVEVVNVEPRLIVIDTLAQTLHGGEENGAGMQTFVANATALANHFNACVLAVHHVPLADDRRLRGHTSLHGGADAELLTERIGGDLATTLSLEKLKDEEDRIKLTVRLGRIVIGNDGDGDEVSTLVVSGIEVAERTAKGKTAKMIPAQRRLLMEVIAQAIDEAGQDLRSFSDGPMVRAVYDEAVRQRYYARIAEQAAPDELPSALAERQRKAFTRSVKAALDAKHVMARAEDDRRFLWLP
jgi:putative component of toxin-antitoxin plasmid stabilization module